jgi:WD40 repeat protein
LRLVAAAAATAIAVHTLSNPDLTKELARLQIARGEHGVQITWFALSPSNGQIATTNTAGRVALRDQEDGWQVERNLDFPEFATGVAFSPDGRSIAVVGRPFALYLRELDSPTGELIEVRFDSIERPRHVMYSPSGQFLAVTSDLDGTIVIWDLATRKERLVLAQPSPVVRMAFSPDGRWLACAGSFDDNSIYLWDLQTGSRRFLLENGPGAIIALVFSPDGACLASAGFGEHHVRLWDLDKHQVCRQVALNARSVNSVAFSPDGSLLATASNDGVLGLWTVSTGQRLLGLDTQATCLRTVAFSPDGRSLILATADDDDLRVWYVADLLAASEAESQKLAARN